MWPAVQGHAGENSIHPTHTAWLAQTSPTATLLMGTERGTARVAPGSWSFPGCLEPGARAPLLLSTHNGSGHGHGKHCVHSFLPLPSRRTSVQPHWHGAGVEAKAGAEWCRRGKTEKRGCRGSGHGARMPSAGTIPWLENSAPYPAPSPAVGAMTAPLAQQPCRLRQVGSPAGCLASWTTGHPAPPRLLLGKGSLVPSEKPGGSPPPRRCPRLG